MDTSRGFFLFFPLCCSFCFLLLRYHRVGVAEWFQTNYESDITILDKSSQKSKNFTEPVTTQPSPVASATSRVTTILCTGGSWSTGLLDIFQDEGVCVWGLLCSPCLECSLASHYGECCCFPLLLGSTVALRTSTRERFKIRGTLFGDWMVVHCCWPFAVCQMAREIKRRPVFQVYETSQLQPVPPAKGAFV